MNLRRLVCLSMIGFLTTWASAQHRPCDQTVYENRNVIEYGPLVVKEVRGTVTDPSGVLIPGACIAIFTAQDYRLISAIETDKDGTFVLPKIPLGNYRLVAVIEGLCPANARLQVVHRLWRKRILHAHLKVGGLDTCSFISLK